MENIYKFISGILILFAGCFQRVVIEVKPESVPSVVYENIFMDRSFKYHYSYGVKGEIPLTAEYRGKFKSPDREKRKGYLRMGVNTVKVNVVCIDGYQYEKEEGRWKVRRRDDAINILLDVQRLFNPKRMKFVQETDKFLIYRGRIDVSYVIPASYKKIYGDIYIDKKDFNLRKIIAEDSTSGLYIELELYGWDSIKKIRSPLKKVVEVVLDSKVMKADRVNLKKRFEKIGASALVKSNKISIDVPLQKETIRKIIRGGKAYFVSLQWNGDTPLYFEPTVLVNVIDTIGEIKVDSFYVKIEEGKTSLYLRVEENIFEQMKFPVGILFDQVIYAAALKHKENFVIFNNVGTYEDALYLGMRLTYPTKGYKVIKYRRIYE